MSPQKSSLVSLSVTAVLLSACGGGGGGGSGEAPGSSAPQSQSGSVAMMVSDASTENWATIGVKILSIALVPQGGGANVVVYTAPSVVPTVNLAELDQLAEILGNVSVPVGTYTAAVLTVSANPGDISLVVAADPATGFAGTPGATIASSAIQIQHTKGSSPHLTVPITVDFVSPLVVSAGQNNALDLEFDLGHPAFLVGHVPPGAGQTMWGVNFSGPVRHHPLRDLPALILRHMYGDVTSVSSDNASITITKEFPTEPAVSPEIGIATTQSLQIDADATNGTIFYDVDAKTRTVISSFASVTGLAGKVVRVAARYQEDGTLVATRIWASSTFNNVWLSPEGHVLHVNANNNVVTIENESGRGVDVVVNANTQFFFRQPADPSADSQPIGTGTAFLADNDLVRGFKVHASVVDPLATPLVAQSIDIETADYDGTVSAAGTSTFTLSHTFRTAHDDYVKTLGYVSSSTANGMDDNGAAITGFKWWNFAYPTVLMNGSAAVTDFAAATNGSINFGGSVGAIPSHAIAYTVWNDSAAPNAWSAAAAILTPSTLPLGFVASGYANGQFTMTVIGGASAAPVSLDSTQGSATLVYQVNFAGGILTVSPIDITTSSGMAALTAGLVSGAPVKVYGTPQADGTLKAYVITYFTGQAPAQ
ncbi:MAG TPA: DUF4382 domain-containing protein [Steroidobacteraceae bacterium]|nr:DUF4382 domain-containing protein [Steroidobacteraceae bacterium]